MPTFIPMQWDTTDRPAPQLMTHGELETLCDLMQKAGMKGAETFIKIKILADYAHKRTMQTGRAYIQIKAE